MALYFLGSGKLQTVPAARRGTSPGASSSRTHRKHGWRPNLQKALAHGARSEARKRRREVKRLAIVRFGGGSALWSPPAPFKQHDTRGDADVERGDASRHGNSH